MEALLRAPWSLLASILSNSFGWSSPGTLLSEELMENDITYMYLIRTLFVPTKTKAYEYDWCTLAIDSTCIQGLCRVNRLFTQFPSVDREYPQWIPLYQSRHVHHTDHNYTPMHSAENIHDNVHLGATLQIQGRVEVCRLNKEKKKSWNGRHKLSYW